MPDNNLVARIGQIATKGKHKERFLFVGTIEPVYSQDKFFYLIEINSPWSNGEKIKNVILKELTEKSQNDNNFSINSFESIIKNINNNLAEIASSGEHEWIGKLNSIIGGISNNEIIFSQTGDIAGYLFRGKKISHITEKQSESLELIPQKTFLSLINGEISDNDKIIIANSKLYDYHSLDKLRHILTNLEYKDSLEEISKDLKKAKIKDVNLLIFEFTKDPTTTSDKPDTKAEMIILDEILEPKLLKYAKKTKMGAKYASTQIVSGGKNFIHWWQKNIQPKIKQKIDNYKNKSGQKNNSLATNNRFSSLPKINYFNNQHDNRRIKLSSLSANLFYWTKNLFKTENRKYLYISLITLFLLFGFIKIQINSRNNSGIINQTKNLESLNEARNLYTQAIDEVGKNQTSGKDKMIEAMNLAEKATESVAIKEEAKNLFMQIQGELDKLNFAIRIKSKDTPNYTLEGDNPLIYSVGSDIFSFSKNGKIYRYDTRKKSSSNIASIDKSSGEIISLSFSANTNIFYLYTSKHKMLSFNVSSTSLNELTITDEEQWAQSKSISIFSSNIYLLNFEKGNIWRYSKINEEYQKATNYLSKHNPKLVDSVSMAIDGDIYVLIKNGDVVKIRRSNEDTSFSISAPPKPDNSIKNPAKIFTDPDTTTIYILDKDSNRIIQYTKTGQYKRQFVADKEIEITDFAVNEKVQKIWILSNNNVFEIEI